MRLLSIRSSWPNGQVRRPSGIREPHPLGHSALQHSCRPRVHVRGPSPRTGPRRIHVFDPKTRSAKYSGLTHGPERRAKSPHHRVRPSASPSPSSLLYFLLPHASRKSKACREVVASRILRGWRAGRGAPHRACRGVGLSRRDRTRARPRKTRHHDDVSVSYSPSPFTSAAISAIVRPMRGPGTSR